MTIKDIRDSHKHLESLSPESLEEPFDSTLIMGTFLDKETVESMERVNDAYQKAREKREKALKVHSDDPSKEAVLVDALMFSLIADVAHRKVDEKLKEALRAPIAVGNDGSKRPFGK